MAAVKYHPETVQLVEMLDKIGRKFDKSKAEIKKHRLESEMAIRLMNGISPYQFGGTKFELFIPSPEWPDGIPIHIYHPASPSVNPPILVFFHGGGMSIGSRNFTDITCKMLSDQSQCIIVNTEYRLYPENKFEAPYDDAAHIVKWVIQNKRLIGASNKSKVGVGGDSAGGKLSATVSHEVPGIAFQILVYPHVSATGARLFPSYEQFKDAPILSQDLLEWFEMHMKTSGYHPRSDSLSRSAESFKRLPPALIIVAEVDPIRDEGIEYAKKLKEYNVIHDFVLIEGACHGFYTMPSIFKECCKIAYKSTTDFINKYGSAQSSSL